MATGIYQDGDRVLVRYEERYDVEISRKLYEQFGHLPLFDALPTKQHYEEARRGVIFVERS